MGIFSLLQGLFKFGMEDLYEKLSGFKCDDAEATARAVCLRRVQPTGCKVSQIYLFL